MTRGFYRRNNGPCAVCGLQNSNEKFRKLTLEALTKTQNSPAAPLQPPQPLRDISNYQQFGSLNNTEEDLLARFVSSEINNTQSTLEFFF